MGDGDSNSLARGASIYHLRTIEFLCMSSCQHDMNTNKIPCVPKDQLLGVSEACSWKGCEDNEIKDRKYIYYTVQYKFRLLYSNFAIFYILQ